MTITEFDRWVGENNIPDAFEYGKGWWTTLSSFVVSVTSSALLT